MVKDKAETVAVRDKKKGDIVVMRKELGPKGGRHRLVLTEDGVRMVESLASIGCTITEIAATFGVSEKALTAPHNSAVFYEALNKGHETEKVRVRRAQMSILEKGSAPMAIFLGKNVLGQSDRSELTISEKRPEDMDLDELAEYLRKRKAGR